MVMDPYLVHYNTLSQSATTILLQNATRVYYKMRQVFIRKCYGLVTKYDSYYKMR